MVKMMNTCDPHPSRAVGRPKTLPNISWWFQGLEEDHPTKLKGAYLGPAPTGAKETSRNFCAPTLYLRDDVTMNRLEQQPFL